jgi:tetratricopeptide (TPR) repeat protein
MSTKRFRIALSFAGEKRDFVAKVARILADRFDEKAILYDKYHEAEFARYDLGIHLPKLYRDQSDLVVAVLCKDYDVKLWTGWEWMAIHAQLNKNDGAKIMLSRFDHSHVDGLFENAGFVELDHKTPKQAAALILQRLALNEGRDKDHYLLDAAASHVPSRTSTPNNLPQLPYFFGRQKDLDTIAAALRPEERTWIVLIDGPGGIGKTTLAIRAAQLAPESDYPRIVFVSSKRSELDPSGPTTIRDFRVGDYLGILNAIARELGDLNFERLDEKQRPTALHALLRSQPALLVVDNLENLLDNDRLRVLEFLKNLPQGTKAIVTSRKRTDVQATLLRLEHIAWEDAAQMLEELARNNKLLAGATEEERRALHKESGGNPLIIRWVAGQLGRGQARTVACALGLLRQSPAGEDALEFIFGDIAKNFTGDETHLMAALAHFSLPVEVHHVAELSGVAPLAAQAALETLADRALVIGDVELRQFVLTPLIAGFLRRKCPEVIAETGSRLEEGAYALIVENGYQKHDRLPVLDAAWPTVAPALPLFVAGPNERLQTVCRALHRFLNFTGRWDEWLSLSQQAEAKAVAAGDHDNAGWRAYDAGYVQYLRGQADAVLTWADRAAAHWQTARAGARQRGSTIRLRGLGHRLKADYPTAIALFCEALDLWRTLSPENEDVAIALNARAEAQRLSGDLVAAEGDYREALRVARAVGYAEGEATYTGNLAALALRRKDWRGAETLAREALPLCKKVGRLEMIAANCHCLALALVRQGKAAEALPYARPAVDIYTQLGSPNLDDARATLVECGS